MRTILVLALAANVFFSVGSGYLQGAIVSKATANGAVSLATNAVPESTNQHIEF